MLSIRFVRTVSFFYHSTIEKLFYWNPFFVLIIVFRKEILCLEYLTKKKRKKPNFFFQRKIVIIFDWKFESMRRFCYLLCIFLVLFHTTKSNDVDKIDQLPHIALVDQLTKDYLEAEEKLWEVIERREDSTLQQIYNVHTEFLNRNYGESNVLLNGVYTDNVDPKLLNNIIKINETSHDIAREFFEHRNYTVLSMKALDGINLDKTFASVCEQTINSTDFWSNLQNVSDKRVIE